MRGNADLCSIHGCNEGIYSSLTAVSDGNFRDSHIGDHGFCGRFDGGSDFTGRAASLKGIRGDQYIHG